MSDYLDEKLSSLSWFKPKVKDLLTIEINRQ